MININNTLTEFIELLTIKKNVKKNERPKKK